MTDTKELYMGLGSALYALAKTDGHLQPEESETLKTVLSGEPNGEAVLEAFHVHNQYNIHVEDAYAYAFRRFTTSRKALDEETKKRFLQLMERLADAHDGVSRKENEFIRRFRRDLGRL